MLPIGRFIKEALKDVDIPYVVTFGKRGPGRGGRMSVRDMPDGLKIAVTHRHVFQEVFVKTADAHRALLREHLNRAWDAFGQ